MLHLIASDDSLNHTTQQCMRYVTIILTDCRLRDRRAEHGGIRAFTWFNMSHAKLLLVISTCFQGFTERCCPWSCSTVSLFRVADRFISSDCRSYHQKFQAADCVIRVLYQRRLFVLCDAFHSSSQRPPLRQGMIYSRPPEDLGAIPSF